VDINIKDAEITDFLEISELDRRAWGENKDAQFVPDGEHVWRLWVEYAVVCCAVHDKNIIGVIIAFPAKDSSVYLFHKIFIDYDFRDKGVGKRLFSALCKKLDELNVDCSLTTSPENQRMIAICKKFGFTQKVFIKSYYRQEEDRFFITRTKRTASRID